MDNEWDNIINKSKIRVDKFKDFYLNFVSWIPFVLGSLFFWAGRYTQINYPETILSTIGLFLLYISCLAFFYFFCPLFTRIIIPVVLKILIFIINGLASLIKRERD